MNLLCGFYPRLAGQIYYTTKEIPFHRLTFTEPRDYRVVFFIQKNLENFRGFYFRFKRLQRRLLLNRRRRKVHSPFARILLW